MSRRRDKERRLDAHASVPLTSVPCDEFDEISQTSADDASPEAIARELFAHAMLDSDRIWRRDGSAGQEARVQNVLRALERERAPSPLPLPLPRPLAAKRGFKIAWVAAALLVFGLVLGLWPDRDTTQAYAEELFDRALTKAASSTHVYDVELRFRKRSRTRTMRLALALASGNRFHAKVESGGGMLADGAEFGSNGTVLWARSRSRGSQAFDLALHDPDSQPWGRLGPALPYYELRPFLEAQYGKLGLEVQEVRGDRVVVTGAYDRKSERIAPAWDEKRRTWKPTPRIVRTLGELRVEIDEASGHMMRLLRTVRSETTKTPERNTRRARHHHAYPRLEVLDLRRRHATDDPSADGFDFDPPRMRANPFWLHFSRWRRFVGSLMSNRARRNASKAQSDENRDKKTPERK